LSFSNLNRIALIQSDRGPLVHLAATSTGVKTARERPALFALSRTVRIVEFARADVRTCIDAGTSKPGASLHLYLAAHEFWTVMAVSLLQAAALAPLVPLADALSLAHARPRQNAGGFEYGWVRGVGSAAFVAGTLLAGQAAGGYGLSAIIWLSATALLTTPIATSFVPAFPAQAARDKSKRERFRIVLG
jgi:MFS family permease